MNLKPQACHLMTSNPARQLYTCHLLGAYILRNVIMKIAKATPVVPMCEAPELFSSEYFFNKNLLYMDGEELCFYEIGKAEAVVVKKEVEGVEAQTTMDGEELTRELIEVRKDVGTVRTEVLALKGRFTDLAGKSSLQNERMAEAVAIMMKIAAWLEKKFPQPPKELSPGPSNLTIPPGQGSSTVQKPVVPLSLKKPIVKPVIVEEEEPASPAKKKIKTNRPSATPKSGSRGGQTQN